MEDQQHHHDHSCHPDMPRHDARDLIVREDIMAKAKELAELITTSEEVQTYRKAEQLIQGNTKVQDMIKLLKKKQKEIVAFEKFENQSMVTKIEQEMDQLQSELDQMPIVNQFQQTQSDINYLLQMIISVIKDTVADNINVEAGTEAPPSKCGD